MSAYLFVSTLKTPMSVLFSNLQRVAMAASKALPASAALLCRALVSRAPPLTPAQLESCWQLNSRMAAQQLLPPSYVGRASFRPPWAALAVLATTLYSFVAEGDGGEKRRSELEPAGPIKSEAC